MTAVLIHTGLRTGVALWATAALCVAALGIGPLFAALKLSKRTQRILIGLLVAAIVSAPLKAVICGACIGCDPWWLEYFWICIPAN
jgi:uncharacterized membrane protein YgaE (UPF0421/DUF939 family)